MIDRAELLDAMAREIIASDCGGARMGFIADGAVVRQIAETMTETYRHAVRRAEACLSAAEKLGALRQ
jgi:hypothetical protein